MGRILRYTLAGMLGALIAWAIVNPFLCAAEARAAGHHVQLSYAGSVGLGIVSGLFVGLLLGVADALGSASRHDATRTILTCAGVGAVGGIIGFHIGNVVYGAALSLAGGAGIYNRPLPPGSPAPSALAFVLLVLGRGFGWALVGASIGAAHGIAKRVPQKTINGAVGGFIGGGIGGSFFEILVWIGLAGALPIPPSLIGSEPSIYRFLTYAITGGAIGLFIGFVEEITKRAWLIRLVGRNEGKEILLYKPVTILGRDEYADIPIFGDPDVAPKHATINASGQRHFIEDAGSTYGTFLNASKTTKREMLQDGDLLLIGKTKFMFRDKATAKSGGDRHPSQVQIPTSSHVCQFCGAVKDANGNCDCTVGGAKSTADPGQSTQQLSSSFDQQQATQRLDGSLPSTLNPQPSTQAKLVGMSGPYAGQTFIIDRDMHIGRESTKDIALPMDNAVSRNHARIAIENGDYVLYDDGSTNGTHVNNAKIVRQPLTNADTVQIGSTKFRFEDS